MIRLLKLSVRGELSLEKFDDDEIPPLYAILSHTWGADGDEISFNDVQRRSGNNKAGYAKIRFCGQQARKDSLEYFWVDTCCIDKANHTELSEAITSMFRWYREAKKCYVYLSDVPAGKCDDNSQTQRPWESAFRNSRWFTRGWTLQELLAPESVEFFSEEGDFLGDKNILEQEIHKITGIPITALHGSPLCHFSIDERMRWADKRKTKKIEDKAYCLLGIFDVFMPPLYGEADNALIRLKEEINKRSRNIKLIPYAPGAIFNSYDQDHTTCHHATRIDVLRQIHDWAQQNHSKSIFWLNGMAGIGKSTISWTFAEWLTHQSRHGVVDLGASFFFKRGEGDRGNASRFFSTIARDLVIKVPDLNSLVAEVIVSDPSIFDKALGEQFDKLIYQPLQKVNITPLGFPTLVVVVDALDECEKEKDIQVILDLWSRLPQITTVRLKLFLTSRPELPIQLGFRSISADAHHDMILHDEVPRKTIQRDISAFLKDKFSEIRTNYNAIPLLGIPLDFNWPGDTALRALVDMAIPLFIVATTISLYVGDSNFNPQERLKEVLQFQGMGQLEQMEKTYLPVLTQLPSTLSDPRDKEKLYQDFRTIVGSIITLAEPFSIRSLAVFLNIRQDTIVLRLRPLLSVLRIPVHYEIPVRTLHLSFSEFLLSEKLQYQPFGVDGLATHRMLLTRCLALLSGPDGLRENLCDLSYPGQLRRELDSTVINERLSPALQYACRYWVHHAQQSKAQIHDDDEVHLFLQRHFLHWLEALSLVNRLAEVIGQVGVLQSLESANNSALLSSFLEDARRVVLANRYIGDLAPLQIYSSAIVFAPQNSIVRNICGQIPAWIRKTPITPADWSLELQKLEGHVKSVTAVAFSPDGLLLASGSHDETVRLWNVATGQEVQKLKGHTSSVTAVAFSPDGLLLASGSHDQTVRLWNIATGQEVQKLKGHTSSVTAVAFSPDGSLLASGSHDQTVRLWNVATGQEVQKLKGHTSWITAVAFSPDGSLLASGSHDETVRLWNVATGQEVQKLKGHTSWITAVAFSPDNLLLASGSRDETVRLWNVATGQEVQKFENVPEISSISLAADNSTIFTNRGAISVENGSSANLALESSTDQTSMIKNGWIQRNNRNCLWLQQEYRSAYPAFHDNTFAFGLNSGQVSFIQLNHS